MPVEVKQFNGLLNSDDSNNNIGLVHHKMAKNIRFRGTGNNMRAENVEGTTLISNNLPAGSNECLGAFFDELKQRIFWFNYNSNGTHGIYQYTLSTGVIATVVIIGAGTDGDILAFDLNYPVYAVKMLYGDTTQGDTLYWNNSQRQPCQINIKMALAGTYGVIKRTYIDVIKAPASIPPAVTYENDATVTVNNMRKKLFKFKTRYVYNNNDKSVWSSQGQLPLPVNYLNTAIDTDPTKNCRVAIVVPTGDPDVAKIEIAAATSEANTFGDYFLIKVIDKSAESVPSNDITTYRFYNNQAYVPIDVEESIQLFDLVPLNANALEFLNGNVPIYGAITEGFNKTVVTGTVTSSYETQQTTQPKFIFASNQSGDSGFGTGNIHAIVLGAITVGDTFNIYTTNQTITFVATVATTANVIAGLAAAAVVAGFTVVSSDTENLYIVKTGEVLQRSLGVPLLIAVSDSFVYDRNSRYNFVLVYFDKAGRSIGSLTSNGMNVQTINYTETTGTPNIPKIQLSISSRPPLYAYYYQIGRTKNLTKLTKLEWVSDRTYKDTEFAYISIENLNAYILKNPSSKFLAYDFSPNDRIRFMKVLSGSTNTVYVDKDFEIQSQVFSPNINGVQYIGQFVKIALPTTSGTFDFGTSDFFNYFIELYTPAQSVAEGLDLDYEFGERYTIGNAGTVTAYHQGMLQNQTANLVTPATFEFTQGDFYYRSRVINTGAEYIYKEVADEEGVGRLTVGLDYYSSTYTDANITTGNSPLQSLAGWSVGDNSRYLFKIGTGTFNFRLKGTLNVIFWDFGEVYSFYFESSNPGGSNRLKTYIVTPQYVTQGTHAFPFDVTLSLTSSQLLYILGWSEGDFHNSKTFSVSDFEITRELPYTVGCIDPNFSDFFESAVNSNGRGWIVDANAAQVFNPTLMRWGLAYQPNTNINQTNRFKPLNFNEVDRGKGQIQAYKVRENILRLFQERGCGTMGIYAKYLQDTNGEQVVTTTDEIITRNNINYVDGIFGVGGQPTGIVSGRNQDYFIDPIRGYQLRWSGDGLTPISEIYKGQFYIQPLFPPYNSNYIRPNGAIAKILGCYNYFEEECINVLQGGILNGSEIFDHAFSFNEKRNAYCTFFDFNPEWILSAEDKLYSWKNGQLYVHNNTTEYTTFYGNKFYPSIKLAFNDKEAIRKKYLTLGYQSNKIWVAPINGDINTSMINQQTGLPQISQLIEQDFSLEENIRTAAFLRDANSSENAVYALLNGDYLGGNWLEINLTYLGNDFSYLYLPYINWEVSNRNF